MSQGYYTQKWIGDSTGYLSMLDQTRLPAEKIYLECRNLEAVFQGIKRLSVRGAPAIGIAAAYGVVIGTQQYVSLPIDQFKAKTLEIADYLATSRPTAVNLFWALNRMTTLAKTQLVDSAQKLHELMLQEARMIEEQDREMCTLIGKHGAPLLKNCTGVLTHCNTGALATGGTGTAFSVILQAWHDYRKLTVYADETRPLLQGARLTSWEFQQRDVPVKLITDSMAGWVMKNKLVQAVVVGADRIAANGDSANKIGTYALSILAAYHNIPFYIAAPSSTFDLTLSSGDLIPIEERRPEEITQVYGTQLAPQNTQVYNPAFDVAPATCIAGIITEKGIITPVNKDRVEAVLCANLS